METAGLPKKEIELRHGDNRGDDNPEAGSYSGKEYDEMLAALEKNGDPDLRFFIENLSMDIKEKLDLALRSDGQGWNLLAKIDTAYSSDAIKRIQEWIKEARTQRADTAATSKMNKSLVLFLEQL